ncbi:MAG: peptide chain release factor N(5)-glutamine methyltransferase [Gammaproteobacteria bacterium]|nr:peptide chain release factor N(5)-glutamine methyltransferase [Gammaproteobacteria bacterium]
MHTNHSITLQSALTEAIARLGSTSGTPQLDAEILLCTVLGKDRSFLRTWPERELDIAHYAAFDTLINRRRQGQPIAYLTGSREFWSREFIVTPDVLIPRPETELLIEHCLELIPFNQSVNIVDLGTGSGIIAVTLAAERPQANLVAVDISAAALQVAKMNAARHGVDRIRFYQSNWLKQIPPGLFDVIISNPPYIAADDPHLQQGDLRFEPQTALTSGADGLKDIRIIAKSASNRLNKGGFIVFEHGYDQGLAAQELLKSLNFSYVQTINDLAGQARVTSGQYLPPD